MIFNLVISLHNLCLAAKFVSGPNKRHELFYVKTEGRKMEKKYTSPFEICFFFLL